MITAYVHEGAIEEMEAPAPELPEEYATRVAEVIEAWGA